jgi:dTDP-4-dehydrorhamnose reductase
MIARVFRTIGDPVVPGVVFARGVANSQMLDEAEYAREQALLCNALGLARGIGEPLVYFSGSPIYGDFSRPVTETSHCRPGTRYGRHQAECEELIRRSQASFLIVRLPNAVGAPGNPYQLIPSLVSQVLGGRVSVQRSAARDLLDVTDIVRLAQRLTVLGAIDNTINVASGVSTPVPAIVGHIVRILGAEPIIDEREGGEAQQFDISRLATIVGPLPFDGDYPIKTLARYVPGIAASLVNGAGQRPSDLRL